MRVPITTQYQESKRTVDAAEAVKARLEQAEELLETTREELVEARAQLEAAAERAQQQEARAAAAEGRAAEEAEERKVRPRRNAEVRAGALLGI